MYNKENVLFVVITGWLNLTLTAKNYKKEKSFKYK